MEEEIERENLETESFKHMSLDDLKFIFSQSEKKLDDTIKNFDLLTTKTLSVIGLMTTMFFLESSYFFTNNQVDGVFNPKVFAVLCVAIYTFFVILWAVSIVSTKDLMTLGSLPSGFFKEGNTFDPAYGKDLSAKYLYLGEIESYNYRIKVNNQINADRHSRFNTCLVLILFSPVLCTVLYLLSSFAC